MKRLSNLRSIAAASALLLSAASGASAGVVINEGYGGGGNSGSTYTHDYIELFNNTLGPIDISGYQLNYASVAGAFTPGVTETNFITLIPAATPAIPAGGFFLVQEAQGAGGSVPLPSPNLVDATPIAMGATGFKVQLLDAAQALVDLLGVGTANAFEGTGAAPATTNTTSAQRFLDGVDTNNNNVDFGVGAPTPGSANLVPEPATFGLLALGGLVSVTRRSRRR